MNNLERTELIQKTNEFINSIEKYYFTPEEINFCKTIHQNRQLLNKQWQTDKWGGVLRDTKISRWHSDDSLYFGLLCELLVCRYFNKSHGEEILKKDILREWAEDQIRQNNVIGKTGQFDCKDVGKAQVRASEYSKDSPRRVIYRENDFRTKAYQPVIGCVYGNDETGTWGVICGYMTYDELKENKSKYWGDPDKRGYKAMWIPLYNLTPIEKFDIKHLG
jgi:hypothetical protein